MSRYFKNNLPLVLFALIVSILTALTTPVVALMEQRMIDLITSGKIEAFRKSLILAGVVVVITALVYFCNALAQKKFKVRFEEDLRNDIYSGIMRQSHVRFGEKDTAEQLSFVNEHASAISGNLVTPIFTLISYGVMAIVVLSILVYYSPLLAFVSIVCAALSASLPLYFNKKLGVQMMETLEKGAARTFQLKESLNGHETISSYGMFSQFYQRFAKANHDCADADYRMEVTISMLENISHVVQKISWFTSFLIAGYLALSGKITIGTLVMFITLSSEFNGCVTLFAQLVPLLLSTVPDMKMIQEIIDYKDTTFNGEITPTLEKSVDVQNLSFRYPEGAPVLNGADLTLIKGEKIALIGASGCGKSTLIKILNGNYAGYGGTIRYDGAELRDLDIQKLRNLVTVIHQNTFIFNESIQFNICLGEEFDENALEDALRLSGVSRFLTTIQGGLDAPCGENGSQLSGGQKQRIALARALIRGVNFLILDEGVSAIDVETANEIEQELLNMRDLTLLTVTHRIKDSLLNQYDHVLMMDDGRLKERNRKEV